MSKVNEVLLRRGLIDQAKFDKAQAKDKAKQDAKNKDFSKMSKAELIKIVEDLMS